MRTSSSVIFASLQLPCGVHHRWLTIAEAERLKKRGECRRVIQPGKASIGRTRPVYRLEARPEPSNSQTTPPALTFADILANVGLDAKPHRVRADRQARVSTQLKIREYRRVYQHDPEFAG